VNDGGTESFSNLPEELLKTLPITLLNQESRGPAAARNTGANVASGDYLAFTDDDCRVEPDWLLQFLKTFTNGSWNALGGRTLNPYPDRLGPTCWHFLIDFLYEFWRDDDDNALMLVSNNVVYQRTVFEALRGFDEQFCSAGGEDREIGYRLLANGYTQTYCPDANVWHDQRGLSVWGYVQQQFRYGRGGHLFRQKTRRGPDYNFGYTSTVSYPAALWRKLHQTKAPMSLVVVLNMAQMAHRTGRYFEGIKRWLG
jgi:cellulose synthase/poly-beta-1,6-N-acetylglucosamine synthase-like glycosyltransferase